MVYIVVGAVVGILARLLMPGRDPVGFIGTIVIGIVGAIIGGFLGNMLFGIAGVNGFDLRSLLVAIVGSLILLFIYRAATRRNTV